MPFTFYYFPLSQPSRAVLAFIELTKIPHEKKVINILTGDNHTPHYLKINPLGKVPAIDDDGFSFGEGETIIRYLINTKKTGEEFYPPDPKKRVLIDRYFPFHHESVRTSLLPYFQSHYPELWPELEGQKESLEKKVEATLKKFEENYLGNLHYLGGESLSIADFFALGELMTTYYSTDFDFDKFPLIKAYIERSLENPVILEINKPVAEFREMLHQKEAQQKV